MIYTDICDMKSTPYRTGIKCSINFIDNCTRYCYVYLPNGKNKAIETYMQYKAEVESQFNIFMIKSGRCEDYASSFAEIYLEMESSIKLLHILTSV